MISREEKLDLNQSAAGAALEAGSERTELGSPYQRAAARRWPGWTISGDGPHALVRSDLGTIQLFSWQLLAAAELEPQDPAPGRRRAGNLLRQMGKTAE